MDTSVYIVTMLLFVQCTSIITSDFVQAQPTQLEELLKMMKRWGRTAIDDDCLKTHEICKGKDVKDFCC